MDSFVLRVHLNWFVQCVDGAHVLFVLRVMTHDVQLNTGIMVCVCPDMFTGGNVYVLV